MHDRSTWKGRRGGGHSPFTISTFTIGMGWREQFRDKLVTAAEAVRRVKDGDLVRLPMGAVPVTLVNALAQRRDELRDVRVWQGASRHLAPWANGEPGWEEHIQFVSDFLSPMLRPVMETRRADFAVTDYAIANGCSGRAHRRLGCRCLHGVGIRARRAEGRVELRVQSVALEVAAACREAPHRRDQRPVLRTRGDNFVHLSEFDLVVEHVDHHVPPPPPTLTPERIDVTEVIGAYVSTLVNDGDTVQVGTGTLSSTMGGYLIEKNDLGIDSEILVASVVELVKRGVATGRYKTYRPGVATGSFIVPGADFDYCADNPLIELHDIAWVNNVPRIASIRNLVAINQASMIDLTGQVASESIGPTMFTGPGGQLAWSMGALYSEGGRAIHVLPSTARTGTVSRIVAALPQGTIVTVPRTFVDFVITEHGITNLQGVTQRRRALALIELAHPDFRDQLRAEARRLFWP